MTMLHNNYFESRKPLYLYLRSIDWIIDLIKDSIFRLYLCIITQCSSSHKVWSADCRSLPRFWWLSEVSQLSLQLYTFEMNIYIYRRNHTILYMHISGTLSTAPAFLSENHTIRIWIIHVQYDGLTKLEVVGSSKLFISSDDYDKWN